jgi:hypothetical protein
MPATNEALKTIHVGEIVHIEASLAEVICSTTRRSANARSGGRKANFIRLPECGSRPRSCEALDALIVSLEQPTALHSNYELILYF